MSVDDEVAEIAAGDSGGRVALAGVVASGSAPVRAHQTFESGSTVVDGAAGGQKGDAATVAVKRAVAALPGTWWAAGLPKWMHLVRRRMITKEDLFHVHAASGMVRDFKIVSTAAATHDFAILFRVRDKILFGTLPRLPPPVAQRESEIA